MGTPASQEITQLLQAWSGGDQAALEELVPLVRTELRRLARHYMGNERQGHVLQTTALVNEAYVRLIDWNNVNWQNRAHFFGISARLMRNILVDFARRRPRLEGGQEARQVSFDDAVRVSSDQSGDLVALDEALKTLEAFDSRKGRIVELRYFGGLSVNETAEVLKISERTTKREWNKAKAWLLEELSAKECREA
jgi:RNA polymerase sigma factor (TIGR02999 family)